MPPWVKITTLTGIIIGATGAAGSIKASWSVMRYGVPANLVYVDGSVEEVEGRIRIAQQSNASILRDLQIETAEGKKESAVQNKAKWQVERSKTKDPATLNLIDQQLNDLDRTISRLDNQIRVIEQLKSRGQ